MTVYKQYKQSVIAELADWTSGFDMTGVSVSDADVENGSPKRGDMIARNPENHNDRWLVAAAYFAANFRAPMTVYLVFVFVAIMAATLGWLHTRRRA